MTDQMNVGAGAMLLPRVLEFAAAHADRVTSVHDEARGTLTLKERQCGVVFAQVENGTLRVIPFSGDVEQMRACSYARALIPLEPGGGYELLIDGDAVVSRAHLREIGEYLDNALEHWARTAFGPVVAPISVSEVEPADAPSADIVSAGGLPIARLRAAISPQWSWASANAHIPQIAVVEIDLAEPVEHVRMTVTLRDADIVFGTAVVHEGTLDAGLTRVRDVHVPLSARVMSQVDDRRGATCEIDLEVAGQVVAQVTEAVDVQPRDLWNWKGDPLRALQGNPRSHELATSLLASFVRPNHPAISALAREAADIRKTLSGESSFYAFQLPRAQQGEAADASVSAIHEAVRTRGIAYSEPPPGWDYHTTGQRIRDHGEVAGGGLATCMDSAVLVAAVVEDVGLNPVLVLVPGHIFLGYWRQDPESSGAGGTTDWYPRTATMNDVSRIVNLVEAGYLGLIETTAVTVDSSAGAQEARAEARSVRLRGGVEADDVTLIDVVVARQLGVSPLPAVLEKPDGVTEVFEYRPHAPAARTIVEPDAPEAAVRERKVDNHPARYRTWKSSLFSLNATNPLLNLGLSARVQPVVLPPDGLGGLEDMLNQDRSFTVRSGFDVPPVWKARGQVNAQLLLDSGETQHEGELIATMRDRQLFVQRFQRSSDGMRPVTASAATRELRSMAHAARTSREERGMNPLYLCIGILRWNHTAGRTADAPLILVPVNLTAVRGRPELTLTLDATQQTTTNAALIEWLRLEHGLEIPGLKEPVTDRAGIDVDAVITEVRDAVIGHSGALQAQVLAQARLATLDLAAFRMWRDLTVHADGFLQRPLIRHLVETPAEQFLDAAAEASPEPTDDEIEQLETPVPADSTQKRAVLWAKQGRTFVLQGPPGTGKSQTITNMVAECVLSGMKVLFVAEKGTALSVVQRRLDEIGLSPFTLNLHHEGSNAVEVRATLQRALTATVSPDALAMQNARRRLRNARFELAHYPDSLHERNAAGHSAYSARDELLVLGDGRAMVVSQDAVTRHADELGQVRESLAELQRWTHAALVRPGHPWRLAGAGASEPFDVDAVRSSVEAIQAAIQWSAQAPDELRIALEEIIHPQQLELMAVAANLTLPRGAELAGVLDPRWVEGAPATLAACEQAAAGWLASLRGFPPYVIGLDLDGIAAALEHATSSAFIGRKARQAATLTALAELAPAGVDVTAASAPSLLRDLVAVRDGAAGIRVSLSSVPGLMESVPENPLLPGVFAPVRARVAELQAASAGLRGTDEWTRRVVQLTGSGQLDGMQGELRAYSQAWQTLWNELLIQEDDFVVWRGDATLAQTTRRHLGDWVREARQERLFGLLQWCALVRQLEPMRPAGLSEARAQLLDGVLGPDFAEDALARGIARASFDERIRAAGLDRFDATAHNQRVDAYAAAQAEIRAQWRTDVPARLLDRRGGGGRGQRTGGLARELEKTTRRLGTRAILKKHGEAVQQLTPLVLASPSSVVDLIDPGLMEFDLVIFDEASQIMVPEAIGALGRSRAAVIVGDSKQMPPTRRVGRGTIDAEFEEDGEDEVLEDAESILEECEQARVPTLSLSWHYRSQDEQLIAFSNRKYYKGELSSFPTPTLLSSETGVEFRRIAMPDADAHAQARGYLRRPEGHVDGRYLRRGSTSVELAHGIHAGANTNPAEAVAIVEAIRELVARSGDRLPSLGIVTFNEPQRALIEELLIASDDRGIAAVMDAQRMGHNDVLFVKALEQVQGDERDEIIFSVAFSKQANGRIPTNFGPLSSSGGQRRLNVAVTRARRKITVFCSFDPADLDVAGSSYDGPKHLKEFLLAAAREDSGPGAEAGRTSVRDRHRDDIAVALRQAGLDVTTDVGMSNFRLDLVLARPESPEHPLLPVLLDGESWMRRSTVSDRDVLPLEVLRGLMGWPAVARIWWPMWMQNRDLVVSQILEQFDVAERAFESAAARGEAEVTLGEGVLLSPDLVPPTPTPTQTDPEPASVLREVMPDSVSMAIFTADLDDAAEQEQEQASDSASALVLSQRLDSGSTGEPIDIVPGSDQGGVFVAAHTNAVGSRSVLDALPDRTAVSAVRSQILDVIDVEGPIEVGRLIRIVARRFGLSAVRAARAEEIKKVIPRARLKKSALGVFAWPVDLDRATWRRYRISDDPVARSLDEIAPEEIMNAMRAVLAREPDADEDRLLRSVAEIFGLRKLGGQVRSRLQAVRKRLPADRDVAGAVG